jgi:hypothetical protein
MRQFRDLHIGVSHPSVAISSLRALLFRHMTFGSAKNFPNAQALVLRLSGFERLVRRHPEALRCGAVGPLEAQLVEVAGRSKAKNYDARRVL